MKNFKESSHLYYKEKTHQENILQLHHDKVPYNTN